MSDAQLAWPCETCGHPRSKHFKFDEECWHVEQAATVWSRRCACRRYVPRPAAAGEAARYSPRLRQAVEVGMVVFKADRREAIICAPPVEPATLTDDDLLLILQAATEMSRELRQLGYIVKG